MPPQAGRATGGGVSRSPRTSRPAARAPRPVQRRPAAATAAARRFPGPRLTGLGTGLFCIAALLVLGLLAGALFGRAAQTVYGVLFLPVCALTALWVRRGDLLTAPVVVPVGFLVGLVPVAERGDGSTGSRLMGLVTGLATQAGWLYGGTLVAGVIVLVRRMRMIRRERRAGRRAGSGSGHVRR
ncbi:DUF6542 domain-containing protein [Streptomyces composti]|uniref:DUF6542 domain-containing protein n=1 Tax=Streptomyces composti TaxID=2720025 RepID=UPI002810C699|nr:DUF6542 domain-containing protein [Streptomyces composti]